MNLISAKKRRILLGILLLLLTQIVIGGKIHKAAKKGNIAKIKAILKKQPSLLNVKDKYGSTPIHHAAYDGHEKIVYFLI